MVAGAGLGGWAGPGRPGRELAPLCWAAWDPANALVELSKDFTAKTGVNMKFEFVPWPNFADRMLNELNSGGKLCDLMIGDSQWIGGSAENGYYVKLNDFFDKEGIKMDGLRAGHRLCLFDLAEGHAELLGAAGDGRCQRLVLSQGLVRAPRAAGGVQGEVWPRPGAAEDLGRAQGDIAEFFQSREIDGKKVYGAAIFTERGVGRHHHGRDRGALLLRLQVRDRTPRPYAMDGFGQLPGRGQGLEILQGALQVLHAARLHRRLHAGRGSMPSSPARWRCR